MSSSGRYAEDPLDLRAHVGEPSTVGHARVGHVDVHGRRDVLDEHPVAGARLGELELRPLERLLGPPGVPGEPGAVAEQAVLDEATADDDRDQGQVDRVEHVEAGPADPADPEQERADRQDHHGQPAERGREARGPVHARRLGGWRAAHHHRIGPLTIRPLSGPLAERRRAVRDRSQPSPPSVAATIARTSQQSGDCGVVPASEIAPIQPTPVVRDDTDDPDQPPTRPLRARIGPGHRPGCCAAEAP